MTDEPRKKGAPEPPARDDDDRPTLQPSFDLEAFARASAKSAPPPRAGAPPEGPREAQITMTNETELEKARARSAARSEPPRAPTPSVLSIVDARAKSSANIPQVRPEAPKRSLSPASIEAAVLGALSDQPAPEISERTIEDPVAEMNERVSLGDYSGALEMAELILTDQPGHPEAAACAERCRSVLESMYSARLGALGRVPIVVVPRTQMQWLSIDHRAGFVLSLVDGASTLEMILDVCGMPRLDALRILSELVERKILAFR